MGINIKNGVEVISGDTLDVTASITGDTLDVRNVAQNRTSFNSVTTNASNDADFIGTDSAEPDAFYTQYGARVFNDLVVQNGQLVTIDGTSDPWFMVEVMGDCTINAAVLVKSTGTKSQWMTDPVNATDPTPDLVESHGGNGGGGGGGWIPSAIGANVGDGGLGGDSEAISVEGAVGIASQEDTSAILTTLEYTTVADRVRAVLLALQHNQIDSIYNIVRNGGVPGSNGSNGIFTSPPETQGLGGAGSTEAGGIFILRVHGTLTIGAAGSLSVDGAGGPNGNYPGDAHANAAGGGSGGSGAGILIVESPNPIVAGGGPSFTAIGENGREGGAGAFGGGGGGGGHGGLIIIKAPNALTLLAETDVSGGALGVGGIGGTESGANGNAGADGAVVLYKTVY